MSRSAHFEAGKNVVVPVQFSQEGKTCQTCRGYGRIRGETKPHPSGIGNVTPTSRCKDCGGMGSR